MSGAPGSVTEQVQTRPRAAWAGLALALIALVMPLILRPGPPQVRAVQGPAALLEMILPGVLQAGPGGWLLPAGNHVLAADVTPPFRGHVVVLLALFALLAGRGRLAGTWRVLFAAFLSVFLVWPATQAELLPWLGPSLALGAGAALRSLDTRAPEDRGGPGEMLFGVGLLLFAAPLALIAIRAGAGSNYDWILHLLPTGAAPSEGEFRDLATALQRALDFNALSAFFAMAVLLWHLKSRSLLSQSVLLFWAAFELSAWPATLAALSASV